MLGFIDGIALDQSSRQIYWTEVATCGPCSGTIWRADYDGKNLQSLVATADEPSQLSNARFDATIRLDGAAFSATTRYNQWTAFPAEFDPVARRLMFIPSPVGDFDANDQLDLLDIDRLQAAVRASHFSPMLNVNGDPVLNHEDLVFWVKNLKHTWFGDADLDGQFNSSDLVHVFQAGEYEDRLDENSSWASGDWNADGEFTSSDLVVAFQDGGYEEGPRPAAAVPEARLGLATSLLVVSVLFSMVRRCDAAGWHWRLGPAFLGA
jgi:hypothetical protein